MELAFADNPTALRIMEFQPVHEFLTLGRSVLLDEPGFTVKPEFWLYASVWALTVMVLGSVFFWAAEERYGRVD
jgi:teichoic acid transport system permease protein